MVANVPTRISWIEYARAYAIVLVVLVHASGPPLYAYNSVPRNYWWSANLYDSFARPCVPLFIMISGFLVLGGDKEEALGSFFRKRFAKLFVPYLFWAFVYIGWRQTFHAEPFDRMKITRELFGGTAYYHLTFMNIIIGLYLLAPMLRPYVRNASVSTQLYVLGVWFVLSSLVPLFSKITTIAVNPYLQTTPLFLGHFLFGALFRRIHLDLKPRQLVLLAAGLFGIVILTATLTYRYTKRGGGVLDEYFYTYGSPNVVLMSAASFVLLMAIFSHPIWQRIPVVTPVMRHLGAVSFGIYFTHVIVLESIGRGVFTGYPLTATTFHPLLSIPLITVLVVSICAAGLWVVQKVPGVRFIIP